jgi:hypothetical protein
MFLHMFTYARFHSDEKILVRFSSSDSCKLVSALKPFGDNNSRRFNRQFPKSAIRAYYRVLAKMLRLFDIQIQAIVSAFGKG